jgi:nucleotide-binding universal stress UspA family protein
MTVPRTSSPRIVVGVDGSPSSIDALQWAARIAASFDAEIDAVICWEFPTSYGLAGADADWRPDRDARQILTEAVSSAFGGNAPAGLRLVVEEGRPAKVLIDASAAAAMLVIGSRGHGSVMGLLLGSVSAYCAEHALCPVLIARPAASGNPQPSPLNTLAGATQPM